MHLALSTEPKPAPLISPPNTVVLSAIITGCKVFAKRLDEPGPIKAEVLGIRPVAYNDALDLQSRLSRMRT
ncbi:hypothetical protein Pst134EA_021092 [Puccinia striiformis f. sp. tritici]|uniref:hypothetical protein n=1 Tax=Puccinia striiformis f. sp. tritici TaxID=168172 RepID=UPI002008724B|nr:hypothetical protein Pst134EA_021092 [Puccinia striiformis f. sp. tritici]KAH9457210.1 hypothetical protein Pst134EA_021092 [Puccinia striiformis f. sp. tritici]